MLRKLRKKYNYENYVKEFYICKYDVNEEFIRDGVMF